MLIKLSVSKTKTFLDCKKKYEYTYVQKLPRKTWEFHTLGKFCHKVLEDFHNAYLINKSNEPFNKEMSTAFKSALKEYKQDMTKEMIDECYDMMKKYLDFILHDKKNNLYSSNVIACEDPFSLEVSDKLILNGVIDRVQIDNDGVIHVCDYKTVKNKKYLKNDFFQLLTYAYVILQKHKDIEKVRGSYILLRHDFEYITTEFNVKEILTIKDKYSEYAEQIMLENEYKANPSFLCKFCDHLEICDEGKNFIYPKQNYGETSW